MSVVHVCFVSSNLYPVLTGADLPFVGGAEVQQAIIVRALRRRGYRVSVLTRDHGVAPGARPEGIEIHTLPELAGRGIKGLRWLHPRLTDIVDALRRIDPDVVYFRAAGGPLAACAWYARRHGKRLLYAAASDSNFRLGAASRLEPREAWLYRAALRRCDAVLVQNQAQHELLRRHFGMEGIVVPNCYEEADVQPGRADGPVIWVGTVKPLKRPELFLELAARFPQRRFVLVGGDGIGGVEGQRYVAAIAARARALPNVEMTGFVPFAQVGRHYDGAAALVNTSEVEGFPNTFLQAWVRGIPTLSFVAPAAPDGSTGTLACDDLDAMARTLGGLLGGSAAWQQAGEAASATFARWHAVDAVIGRYDELLSSLSGAALGAQPC
jgi:glycosyltransferase involved in cell wall biosynthesis